MILKIGSRRELPLIKICGYSRIKLAKISVKGFTLIEVMLAVAILSLGIIGILRAYVVCLNALKVSQYYLNAICVTKEKMVEVELDELKKTETSRIETKLEFQGNLNGYKWEKELLPLNKYLDIVKITVFQEQSQPLRKLTVVTYVEK